MTLKNIVIGALGSFAFAIILLAWFIMSDSMGLAGYPWLTCAVGVIMAFLAMLAYRPVYNQ